MAAGHIDYSSHEQNPNCLNKFGHEYNHNMEPLLPEIVNRLSPSQIPQVPPRIVPQCSFNIEEPFKNSESDKRLDNGHFESPLTFLNNNYSNDDKAAPNLQCNPLYLSNLSPPTMSSRTISPVSQLDHQRQINMDGIPEELHVSIDNDDDASHSWRPNNLVTSLSSDFFMIPVKPNQQPGVSFNLEDTQTGSLHQNHEKGNEPFDLSPFNLSLDISPGNPHPKNDNLLYINPQEHTKFQKAHLNGLRYEVMNAKKEWTEMRDEIGKLTQKVKEKIDSQNMFGIQGLIDRLTRENSELRLECQCLCMEVDYYLSGMAPLGEIDERYYQRNPNENTSNETNETQANQQTQDVEEPDEQTELDCSKCTFSNHPAISCCEMCQNPRIEETAQPPMPDYPRSQTKTAPAAS